MDRPIRTMAIRAADQLLRGYIRYSPLSAGKSQAWQLYEERFSWRPEPKVATTAFGFKVGVQLPDHIQKVIWLTGRWEPVITEFFRRTLAPGDTCVDVGANIGYYSLLAAQLVGSSGRVYAIEGSPTIFSLLEGNIARNRALNVEAIHAIAADHEGEEEFWLAWQHNLGQSTAVAPLSEKRGMRSEGRIHCGTLATLVPWQPLMSARLIKIDVEGAERQVLEPLFGHLAEFSRRTVWEVELSPEHCADGQTDIDRIFDAFSRAGYAAYEIRNDYSLPMYLSRPKTVELTPLARAPSIQADVVFRRDQD